MNRPVCIAFLLLALASCTASSPRYGSRRSDAPDIRVLLAEAQSVCRIECAGGVSIESVTGVEVLASQTSGTVVVAPELTTLNITLEPDGRVAAVEDEIVVRPRGGARLGYDGMEYDGVFKIVVREGEGLLLVNALPVETYLEGVLPYEIGDPGPDGYDAVKSQAVAARTYALAKMKARAGGPFDVYATVMDQVYKGTTGRTKVASSAVRDTRGRVLDYNGDMVRAYYSACCGGHTSDIRVVWPQREPADYLYGIPDRDRDRYNAFCTDYKRFRWRYSYSGREMGSILRRTLPRELDVGEEDVGTLVDMRIGERSRSGRVTKLIITTDKREFTIVGDRIRWALMTDPDAGQILPSVLFRLDTVKEHDRISFVSIVGGGNGHGVGMCQNGAIGMSKIGYTYNMILEHYFPGCHVVEAY